MTKAEITQKSIDAACEVLKDERYMLFVVPQDEANKEENIDIMTIKELSIKEIAALLIAGMDDKRVKEAALLAVQFKNLV